MPTSRLAFILLVPEAAHLPQLCSVRIPDHVDDAAVRARLLATHGIEIGGGLGPLQGRIWRIGLMGAGSTPRNVLLCLAALREALAAQGFRGSGDAQGVALLRSHPSRLRQLPRGACWRAGRFMRLDELSKGFQSGQARWERGHLTRASAQRPGNRVFPRNTSRKLLIHRAGPRASRGQEPSPPGGMP